MMVRGEVIASVSLFVRSSLGNPTLGFDVTPSYANLGACPAASANTGWLFELHLLENKVSPILAFKSKGRSL